jgi:hypothetical protein
MPDEKQRSWWRTQGTVIVLLAVICYVPFINKALHIDADMLVHTSRQLLVNPIDPPLGDYGRHMVLHDHTQMPASSVWYRTGHPPLLPLLLAPVVAAAGNREWPLHAALFIFYLLSIVAVWRLLGLFYDRTCSFYGTLIWATSPALLVNSSNIMWDVAITVLTLLSFLAFVVALRSGRPALMLLSGIAAGLAALTKVSALPLYLVCPVYLLAVRNRRSLALWLLPAITLPLLWVVQSFVVYGKIHYLSVGWYSFLLGDIRYRIERDVSYFGGALMLPVFWVWLLIACRKVKELLVCAGMGGVWGIVLVVVLKKPLLFGASYALYAAAGLWLLFRLVLFFKGNKKGNFRPYEPGLVAAFSACYIAMLNIMPAASMRYILTLVPFGLFVFAEELLGISEKRRRVFLVTALCFGALFSIGLSVGDYAQCEADRRLPSLLIKRGCLPQQTWYFGRLSYDWYLYHAGFRNLRADTAGSPRAGEYLVNELVPGDYKVDEMVSDRFLLEPIDTVRLYRWPFRTMGFGAGFYGDDRLPYVIHGTAPQKSYGIYRLRQRVAASPENRF